jgi:hypothetical protein
MGWAPTADFCPLYLMDAVRARRGSVGWCGVGGWGLGFGVGVRGVGEPLETVAQRQGWAVRLLSWLVAVLCLPWCHASVQSLLGNFYQQTALEGAVNGLHPSRDLPGAIYIDALDVNGTIRTGTTKFGPHYQVCCASGCVLCGLCVCSTGGRGG